MNYLSNKFFPKSILPIFACFLISCTSESSDNQPVPLDVKNKLSITQGVFGAITSHDDIGDNHVEFASGFNIDIFYDQPSMDLNEAVTPLVSIQSDEKGFYEHELETGEYCICTRFRRCAPIVIHENEMLRLDYELSTGPGWSLPNDPERALEFSCKKP